MNFHNASFKAAYGTSAQLPPSPGPEVSFAGRSNVGKSSLLNKRSEEHTSELQSP